MSKTWAEEMVYKYHKEIQKLTKERNQLKHQLAEYDSELAENVRENECLKDEIHKLKQQLAEKEKEIDILKKDYEFVAKQYKELMKMGDFVIEQKNQDKIEFAVEQLERAKENLIEDLFDLYRSPCLIYETYGDEYDIAVQDAINNTIDNQIKQLKEGK